MKKNGIAVRRLLWELWYQKNTIFYETAEMTVSKEKWKTVSSKYLSYQNEIFMHVYWIR